MIKLYALKDVLNSGDEKITNITKVENKVVVSVIDGKYPLIEVNLDNKDDINNTNDVNDVNDENSIIKIVTPYCKLKILKGYDITNVCNLNRTDGICLIQRHKFDLFYLDNFSNEMEVSNVINQNKVELIDFIINDINKKNNFCKCPACYRIVGVFEMCEFNVMIQLICHHKKKNQIFILRYCFDKRLCGLFKTVENNIVATFDLYKICRLNKMSRKYSRNSIVTSVTTNGVDAVHILSSNGHKGHVWSFKYFHSLLYFGTLIYRHKLSHDPRGLTCVASNDVYDKILCLCDDKIDRRNLYYSIQLKKI